MNNHPLRPQGEEKIRDTETIVEAYSDMLYRLSFTILRNRQDAEDAVSETLIRYLTKAPSFLEEEHRKAWLLRVATNLCRDMLRARSHRNHLDLDELKNVAPCPTERGILEDVLRLPEKYRTVIYLHYMEGYSTSEIGVILSITPAAVRKRLQYGREKLKLEYEGSF